MIEHFCEGASKKERKIVSEISKRILRWAHEQEADLSLLLEYWQLPNELLDCCVAKGFTTDECLECADVSPKLCKVAADSAYVCTASELLECNSLSKAMLRYAVKKKMDVPAMLLFRTKRWLRKTGGRGCEKIPCELDEDAVDNTSMKISCPCRHCQLTPGPTAKFCSNRDCMACFLASLASVKDSYTFLSAKDNKGNKITDPQRIRQNSHIEGKFRCPNCNHIYTSTLAHFTSSGTRCQYCAKTSGKLCDSESCTHCYERSFASHPDSHLFDLELNAPITPRRVFRNSNEKYFFNCDKCPHSYEMRLNNFSCSGQRCPFCTKSGGRVCGDEDCAYCFEKSFASHPDVSWYSEDNEKLPHEICKFSSDACIFNCPEGHEFKMRLADFTNGRRCPTCKNKTEKLVLKHLIKRFGEDDIKQRYPIKECRGEETDRDRPFDFYVKSLRLVIEIDGDHHFKDGVYHESTICRRDEDIWKTTRLLATGRSIIRIYQPDLLAGRLKVVKCIKAYQKEASRVCYFADDMSIYDKHRKALKVALAAEEE